MKLTFLIIALFLVFLGVIELFPERELGATGQDIEVGVVDWGRDFDKALASSKTSGKPVLALFQEVPGCHGCKKFGKEVLSFPLLVEAIESEFVPVLIYNNRDGKDAELLQRFKEPSWNYQVIRFLDSTGKDLIPRKDKVWTILGVAKRMKQALEFHGREVPLYLEATIRDQEQVKMSQVAFQMYCYWTGEMELGKIEGVNRTEAGHLYGYEVTRVWYDPSEISLAELSMKAAQVKCADKVFAPRQDLVELNRLNTRLKVAEFDTSKYSKAAAYNQKRRMRKTPFAKLKLGPYQATKVNAFARIDPSRARKYLSPKQLMLLSNSN